MKPWRSENPGWGSVELTSTDPQMDRPQAGWPPARGRAGSRTTRQRRARCLLAYTRPGSQPLRQERRYLATMRKCCRCPGSREQTCCLLAHGKERIGKELAHRWGLWSLERRERLSSCEVIGEVACLGEGLAVLVELDTVYPRSGWYEVVGLEETNDIHSASLYTFSSLIEPRK